MKSKITVFCVLFFLIMGVYGTEKKSVVCVSYPEYDWVMNILGNDNNTFEVEVRADRMNCEQKEEYRQNKTETLVRCKLFFL